MIDIFTLNDPELIIPETWPVAYSVIGAQNQVENNQIVQQYEQVLQKVNKEF